MTERRALPASLWRSGCARLRSFCASERLAAAGQAGLRSEVAAAAGKAGPRRQACPAARATKVEQPGSAERGSLEETGPESAQHLDSPGVRAQSARKIGRAHV